MKTLIKTKIKKWGNSQGLRLGRNLLKQLNLKIDDDVDIISDHKSIIIKPAKDKNKKLLNKLLDKITDENRHGEVDWRGPVGREIW